MTSLSICISQNFNRGFHHHVTIVSIPRLIFVAGERSFACRVFAACCAWWNPGHLAAFLTGTLGFWWFLLVQSHFHASISTFFAVHFSYILIFHGKKRWHAAVELVKSQSSPCFAPLSYGHQVEGRRALDDGSACGVASCVEVLRSLEPQLSKLHDAGAVERPWRFPES